MPDDLAPLTTPGCIANVSLTFECGAEPTHAGLVLINDQVFYAFACLEHTSRLIAARRMLDRDRAELERRRHSCAWAASGTHRCRSDEALETTTIVAIPTGVFAGLGAALAGLLWIWRARANGEVLSPVPPRLSRWVVGR